MVQALMFHKIIIIVQEYFQKLYQIKQLCLDIIHVLFVYHNGNNLPQEQFSVSIYLSVILLKPPIGRITIIKIELKTILMILNGYIWEIHLQMV
jgi:hypothetical protein